MKSENNLEFRSIFTVQNVQKNSTIENSIIFAFSFSPYTLFIYYDPEMLFYSEFSIFLRDSLIRCATMNRIFIKCEFLLSYGHNFGRAFETDNRKILNQIAQTVYRLSPAFSARENIREDYLMAFGIDTRSWKSLSHL